MQASKFVAMGENNSLFHRKCNLLSIIYVLLSRMENVSGMTEYTDRELIESTLNGDDHSFSLLVNRHKELVYTMAVRIVKNDQVAEEVAQDTFVSAYRSLKSFEFKSKFSTWVYRITYNLSLNALKKEKRNRDLYVENSIEELENINRTDHKSESILDLVEKQDLTKIIQKCLKMLPSKYSFVLTMFHINELKYEEISEITALPIGTVKSLIFRGRTLLKNLITENYDRWELTG